MLYLLSVAPFVGAWIEIEEDYSGTHDEIVAPFVGAWIEIMFVCDNMSNDMVAPFVGAWIEITEYYRDMRDKLSLRSSERGLK